MKTKTIIKILSVFFVFTLFLTSCSEDELESQEQIENTVSQATDNSNLANRGAPSVMEVKVTYQPWVNKDQMDFIRNYYTAAAGLIGYEFNNVDEEIWTVNEEIWDSYIGSCSTCSGSLDAVIESEEEVRGVDIP